MSLLPIHEEKDKLPKLSQITGMVYEDSLEGYKGPRNQIIILSKWFYLYVTILILSEWFYIAYDKKLFHSYYHPVLNPSSGIQYSYMVQSYLDELEWMRWWWFISLIVIELIGLKAMSVFTERYLTSLLRELMLAVIPVHSNVIEKNFFIYSYQPIGYYCGCQ